MVGWWYGMCLPREQGWAMVRILINSTLGKHSFSKQEVIWELSSIKFSHIYSTKPPPNCTIGHSYVVGAQSLQQIVQKVTVMLLEHRASNKLYNRSQLCCWNTKPPPNCTIGHSYVVGAQSLQQIVQKVIVMLLEHRTSSKLYKRSQLCCWNTEPPANCTKGHSYVVGTQSLQQIVQ